MSTFGLGEDSWRKSINVKKPRMIVIKVEVLCTIESMKPHIVDKRIKGQLLEMCLINLHNNHPQAHETNSNKLETFGGSLQKISKHPYYLIGI